MRVLLKVVLELKMLLFVAHLQNKIKIMEKKTLHSGDAFHFVLFSPFPLLSIILIRKKIFNYSSKPVSNKINMMMMIIMSTHINP